MSLNNSLKYVKIRHKTYLSVLIITVGKVCCVRGILGDDIETYHCNAFRHSIAKGIVYQQPVAGRCTTLYDYHLLVGAMQLALSYRTASWLSSTVVASAVDGDDDVRGSARPGSGCNHKTFLSTTSPKASKLSILMAGALLRILLGHSSRGKRSEEVEEVLQHYFVDYLSYFR
jgi:hypothetical protein